MVWFISPTNQIHPNKNLSFKLEMQQIWHYAKLQILNATLKAIGESAGNWEQDKQK